LSTNSKLNMASTKPKPHIIYRLTLAKSLFKAGIDLCNTNVDIFNFSQGLIALHDALDNFTGAIATHLNTKSGYFIPTLDKIEEHEKQKNPQFSLTSRNELVQLNTIRNNIKHQGITPNIVQNKALINPIISFFQEYSKRFFGLDWELISLADLIKDKKVKDDVRDVEDLIDKEKYKDALNKMAIIKFQVFDESLLRIRIDPRLDMSPPSVETKKLRKSTNIFPHQFDTGWFSELYDRAKFLEKGIDRNSIKQFEDLTAKVGINNAKDWKYVLDHGHNWGELNWTREICIFCFDFLIDIILKQQGKDHPIKVKWLFENHRIRVNEELKIYDKDNNLIYTIPKGEEREVMALGRVDNQWEIFDASDRILKLYQENDKEEIIGFFKEGEEKKIEFLKTQQFTQDENRRLIFVKEIIH